LALNFPNSPAPWAPEQPFRVENMTRATIVALMALTAWGSVSHSLAAQLPNHDQWDAKPAAVDMKSLVSKGYQIVGVTAYEWFHEGNSKDRELRKDYTLQNGASVFECQERRHMKFISTEILCYELVPARQR
jgi:hypothetical protein